MVAARYGVGSLRCAAPHSCRSGLGLSLSDRSRHLKNGEYVSGTCPLSVLLRARRNLPCPRLLDLWDVLKMVKQNAKSQEPASEGIGEKGRQINR
jgi:hypothetical protein